eukprot:1619853-Rhodomonas_salina.3
MLGMVPSCVVASGAPPSPWKPCPASVPAIASQPNASAPYASTGHRVEDVCTSTGHRIVRYPRRAAAAGSARRARGRARGSKDGEGQPEPTWEHHTSG